MPKVVEDLTGKEFGKLTVLGVSAVRLNKNITYVCSCSCVEGRRTLVRRPDLLNGRTKSCGCGSLQNLVSSKYKGGIPKNLFRNLVAEGTTPLFTTVAEITGPPPVPRVPPPPQTSGVVRRRMNRLLARQ